MTTMEKLTILTDAAKYDAACTSSGLHRQARRGRMGSTTVAGCCHTFSADGRCVTLLKVLMTNVCAYDCPVLHQPPLQRSASGYVRASGAGGADHGVLPPQLY